MQLVLAGIRAGVGENCSWCWWGFVLVLVRIGAGSSSECHRFFCLSPLLVLVYTSIPSRCSAQAEQWFGAGRTTNRDKGGYWNRLRKEAEGLDPFGRRVGRHPFEGQWCPTGIVRGRPQWCSFAAIFFCVKPYEPYAEVLFHVLDADNA